MPAAAAFNLHYMVFVARPTERASMAQGLFMVGPGAGP